jgi:uncharacterized protein with LGFP repeats
LLVALAAAVTIPVLAVAGTASADDEVSTGDTVVGEFVQVWPEYEDPDDAAEHGDEGPLSYVETGDGESVRIDTEDVEHLEVGATVEVTVGREIIDTASEELGYAEARNVVDTEVLAAAPAEPTAPATAPFTNSVTVVMAQPAGTVRDGRTLDQVVTAVNVSVADFWEEQSAGSIRLGVTASHDWMTTTAGCSNPFALWNEVARRVGFTQGLGKHLLLYVPGTSGNAGCAYGLGTVGGYTGSGGLIYVQDVSTSLIAHEFGHNFSLGHSSSHQCDRTINGYDGSYFYSCGRTSYWDLYDVMGVSWQRLGSLNVVQARRIYTVAEKHFAWDTVPETVTLAPVSQQGGVRAIRLSDAKGVQYLLEFRPAVGRDAWLGSASTSAGLQPGVLLRRESTGDDTSLLLDATPSSPAGWDADAQVAIPVGTPIRVYDHWHRGGAAFVITVQSVTDSAAIVSVAPTSAIGFAHHAAGGDGGLLGAPISLESCLDWQYGGLRCFRAYQNGEIYWKLSTGAHLVTDPMSDPYVAVNGGSGPWGVPTTDTVCGLAGGGCRQHFEYSNAYWSSTTGVVPVTGPIRTAYLSVGEESGIIGYPTAAQACTEAGGCRQPFQGGFLVTSPATGTRLVTGDVATAWAAQGHQTGPLAYPTTGLICGLKNGGCGQIFQGGRIYTAPGLGAHALTGAIHDAWVAQRAEVGPLGYATGDQVCGLAGGGCKQDFQGGTLYASTAGTHAVSGAIATAWAGRGAEGGALGYPTTGLICGLKSSGCGQVFQGGRIYSTAATGARALSGPIEAAWLSQGREYGSLGYPSGDQVCGLSDGQCKQAFEGGVLYSHPTAGTRVVAGITATAYAAAGGESGTLGFPVTGLICGLKDGGCGQVFQGGRIYTTPATGTHAILDPVHTAWLGQGWEYGPLGYPITGLICGLKDGACGQVFQGGRIYTSSATGTRALSGAVEAAWIGQGREYGPLGYPSGDHVCGLAGGGCKQAFQGGTLYSLRSVGTHPVSGALGTVWTATGAESGPLGYPIMAPVCGLRDGGCGQVFQTGRVYTTAGTGTHAISGPILAAWLARGWERGPLGYPTGDEVCGLAGGGCKQEFQGGTLYSHPVAGTHPMTGPVATAWTATGAESGPLGYPVMGVVCGLKNSGCGQVFQAGRIYTTSATGTHAITGPILDAWLARGWETGPMGYPTSDAYPVTGGTAQDFQGGTLTLDTGTGVVTRS